MKSHSLIRCVIRPSSVNVSDGTLNASLPDIRDMSALEVSPFHGIALHMSTFTYFILLIYTKIQYLQLFYQRAPRAKCEILRIAFVLRSFNLILTD